MMPLDDTASWSAYLRQTLQRYAEPLLRQVASGLFRPRSQWPVDELIERSVATLENAAVVDRRLQQLDEPSRRLLAALGHSRQPRWRLGSLLELLAAFGCAEGPQAVFRIFEAGLLYPDLLAVDSRAALPPGSVSSPPKPAELKSFEQWLGQGGVAGFPVFAHPLVLARAVGTELGLPVCPNVTDLRSSVHEADGLEWPLRLAAVWQQVHGLPLRRTQQGDFFKRDLDRLRNDPLLTAPPADHLVELPDPGLLTVSLARSEGLLLTEEDELRAAALPSSWEEGLLRTLASLWTHLPEVEAWNPHEGWCGPAPTSNPYPSAYLLLLLLLTRLPSDAWVDPQELEQWLLTHHPFWSGSAPRAAERSGWVRIFLLGVAYPLRMLQAVKDPAGVWLIRLSPIGRWLLGIGEAPASTTPFAQTLLVQPNLEIIVYRQALTPGLIARLSQFAAWKVLGSACTMQLQAAAVYRALENGLTFDQIAQTLEQHSMRATPPAVLESLRTWADKRERISVYPAATLFEFATGEELNEALARGLPAVRLSERMLIVADEQAVDFRHFRLTGTRDYALPPEKCVTVDPDGVTLTIDGARSDLLVEIQLQRFAEPVDGVTAEGKQRYRLTPASLASSRDHGLGLLELNEWFLQRSGQPLSAAARLLLGGAQAAAPTLRAQLVLHVATPELAEGLLQWPGTRALIRERLGPTALAIAEEDVPLLQERLQTLGVPLNR